MSIHSFEFKSKIVLYTRLNFITVVAEERSFVAL